MAASSWSTPAAAHRAVAVAAVHPVEADLGVEAASQVEVQAAHGRQNGELAKDGEAVCEIRLSEVDGALLVGVYPAEAYHIRAHQFSWTPLASTKLDELVRPYI